MQSISQSPTDPDFVQDPYGFYDRARSLGDFVWWDEYGMPVAFSHRVVDAVLKDRRFGRGPASGQKPARPVHLRDFYAIDDNSMLELDGPDHARLRRLVVSAFTRSRVMEMSSMVSRLTDVLINGFPDGPFDVIEHFASKLPVMVIGRLLGLPDAMAPRLLDWSHAMVAMYQARRGREIEVAANTAAREFRTYLADFIEHRRRQPSNDLLSDLIAAQDEGQHLDFDELVATVVLLLNAGHEATVHTIGNGLYTLMRLDQPFETVMPNTVATTVEEILRYDPPLHLFAREAQNEISIAGHRFAPGDRVGVCLAAANRDPAVWAAPEVFDPTRPSRSQLAFGAGAHFCVGAPLARLELQIALPALYSPALALRLVEQPRYADLYHFHGLESLVVERTA